MKVLIIGGNGFVGRRLSQALSTDPDIELHVLNRSGKVEGAERVILHAGDRNELLKSGIDRDFDAIVDFVCFTEQQANSAIDFFGEVGRYILISSMSVYDPGGAIRETDFNERTMDLSVPALTGDPISTYQDGKRRAEAAFAQRAGDVPAVFVRFPFILGTDDYTRRLAFHVERIAKREPVFIPNAAARLSFVHSGDAAGFLRWSLRSRFAGPANVASPDAIALGELVGMIERTVGKEAVLATEPADDNASPYGVPVDFFLDTSAVAAAGFEARPLDDWLPALVAEFNRRLGAPG